MEMKYRTNLAQVGGGLVGNIMAIVIGVILLVGVTIPITQDVITNASLSGISLTIANYLPVFEVIGAMLLIVYLVIRPA